MGDGAGLAAFERAAIADGSTKTLLISRKTV
jgi:hypothetical protein